MARPQLQKLKFSGTLKGSASEVSKQLKQLQDELSAHDQDLIDPTSLDKVAKQCMSPSLLLHKDPGVKAYLAACLADLLRLYAPEAPYTQAELKDLFQFLFRQLLKLSNPSDPHFSTYFYTAESLANVKSIVLVADLDAADELTLALFKQAFDTVSSASPKNVTLTLTDLLVQLIDEASALSPDVIDVVLAQFLPKAAKTRPAAFRLAVDVCLGAADKLQRGVCQYFADVLESETPDEDPSDDDEPQQKGKGRKQLASLPGALTTAHGLIAQLSRAAPALLLNVIPILSASLASHSAAARRLTTETLGGMFGEKPGQGDVAAKYPAVWKAWLGRARDREAVVRATVAEKVVRIWKEHPELKEDVERTTRVLLHDTDDRVRYAATAIFRELDYDTAAHHVTLAGLEALAERCKDRKNQVRELAFETLGRFYSLAYAEIDAKDPRALAQFGWIPSRLIASVAFGDANNQAAIRASVRDAVHAHVLPPPARDEDEAAWVDRFLTVYGGLGSEGERRTLLGLAKLAEHRPGAFEYFLQACEQNNGGVIDGDAPKIKAALKQTIKALAARMPDSARVAEDLDKFAQANEKAIFKLLKTMVDPQADQKTLTKTRQEVKKRTAKIGATLVETVLAVVREHAFVLLNKSSIPPLMKRAQAGGDDAVGACALEVLDFIARKKAVLFRSHVAELTKSLADSNAPDLTTAALHALSKLAKVDGEFHPDKGLSVKMIKFAKSDDPRRAKYAATVIALDQNRQGTADDLVTDLTDSLGDATDDELVARFAALGRLARHAIKAFETKSLEVVTKALEVLTGPSTAEEQYDDPELDWLEAGVVSGACLAREGALKVIVNRALAFAGDADEALKAARPVFDTLWPLVVSADEAGDRFARVTGSRVRLLAVQSVLKLASRERFHDEVLRHFGRLAQAAQDPVYDVRAGLITRLLGYLREPRARLPARLNLLLFLMAHEPEEALRAEIVAFVRRRVAQLPPAARQALWEHPFVRLLSLLAHHQDYTGFDSVADLNDMARYLTMYLDCIATAENLPYLYHLALKVKTVRDLHSSAYDATLYRLSELAQHLILRLGTARNWPIPTHAQPVQMPGDIFRSLPDAQSARKVQETQWLSEELLTAFGAAEEKGKKKPRGAGKARVAKPKASPSGKKRAANGGGQRKAKKSKKNTSGYYSEDEVRGTTSEDEGEEGSEEEEEGSDAEEEGKAAPRAGARGGLRSGPTLTSEPEEKEDGMEVDGEEEGAGDESEEEPPKAKAKAKPASASKAKGKATPTSNRSAKKTRSGGAATSSPAPVGAAEKRAARTRGAVKGLAAPRPLRSRGVEPVEPVSDGDEEDDE